MLQAAWAFRAPSIMKLLTLKQTSGRQADVVFRSAGLGSGIGAVIIWSVLAVDLYLLIEGPNAAIGIPRALAAVIGLFLLFVAWLMTQRWRASRRPSNWLMRVRGNDVLIKFRSYENWR